MSRVEISDDGRLSGDFIGIILPLGILIGVLLITWNFWTLIIVPVSILLIVFSFVFFKRYKKAWFDETNFYYSVKNMEISVPLVNILKISPTYWTIDDSHNVYKVYKITFKQKDENESIRIAPFSPTNFVLFMNKLKEINPSVEIFAG